MNTSHGFKRNISPTVAIKNLFSLGFAKPPESPRPDVPSVGSAPCQEEHHALLREWVQSERVFLSDLELALQRLGFLKVGDWAPAEAALAAFANTARNFIEYYEWDGLSQNFLSYCRLNMARSIIPLLKTFRTVLASHIESQESPLHEHPYWSEVAESFWRPYQRLFFYRYYMKRLSRMCPGSDFEGFIPPINLIITEFFPYYKCTTPFWISDDWTRLCAIEASLESDRIDILRPVIFGNHVYPQAIIFERVSFNLLLFDPKDGSESTAKSAARRAVTGRRKIQRWSPFQSSLIAEKTSQLHNDDPDTLKLDKKAKRVAVFVTLLQECVLVFFNQGDPEYTEEYRLLLAPSNIAQVDVIYQPVQGFNRVIELRVGSEVLILEGHSSYTAAKLNSTIASLKAKRQQQAAEQTPTAPESTPVRVDVQTTQMAKWSWEVTSEITPVASKAVPCVPVMGSDATDPALVTFVCRRVHVFKDHEWKELACRKLSVNVTEDSVGTPRSWIALACPWTFRKYIDIRITPSCRWTSNSTSEKVCFLDMGDTGAHVFLFELSDAAQASDLTHALEHQSAQSIQQRFKVLSNYMLDEDLVNDDGGTDMNDDTDAVMQPFDELWIQADAQWKSLGPVTVHLGCPNAFGTRLSIRSTRSPGLVFARAQLQPGACASRSQKDWLELRLFRDFEYTYRLYSQADTIKVFGQALAEAIHGDPLADAAGDRTHSSTEGNPDVDMEADLGAMSLLESSATIAGGTKYPPATQSEETIEYKPKESSEHKVDDMHTDGCPSSKMASRKSNSSTTWTEQMELINKLARRFNDWILK